MFDIKNPKTGLIFQVAEFDFHCEMNFHDAKNACNVLSNGWRLPTISEAELIYKELHLKGKGNFDRKGIYQWYGSYWCEKDSYGLSQVFSFRDGSVNGNAEAYNGCVRVVRNFKDKEVTYIENNEKSFNQNIKDKYIKKITDKFSKTIEYRMNESAILDNNKELSHNNKIDLNIRVFVENNDFLNSKIILAITYYAPNPGTSTILHESVADVIIDNREFLKLDSEFSYSGLDSYYKLEIYNEILGQKSSRAEQIQFNIDLTTLIKIVNSKTIEIGVNKKLGYSGKVSNMINFIGFYNGIFDPNFKKDELIKQKTNILNEKEKIRENLEFQITNPIPKKVVTKKHKEANSKNSNCFIITATMGDPHHPIVEEYRAFRESRLLTNTFGKNLVKTYYKIGPYIAFFISKSSLLQKLSFSFFVNPVYKLIKNDRRKK